VHSHPSRSKSRIASCIAPGKSDARIAQVSAWRSVGQAFQPGFFENILHTVRHSPWLRDKRLFISMFNVRLSLTDIYIESEF
jgi:hypothetical protein